MTPAIRIEALGKQYRIGAVRQRYPTVRDAVATAARATVRDAAERLRGRTTRSADADTIWALRDVSLDIERGQTVGIIGGNGAGKSTLLKILSRITEPTTGRVSLRGRVGSLLEVGTGFHPELTGRENVYLNGAILGMKRVEINRKLDQIVAFAEVERFLDTPVKRYSSGMYLRLAFSVAAHLEPDVLIVDEVLAVGDAAFQQKCLGKMSTVAQDGRTVLFVSHTMSAIQRLCSHTVLLERGRLVVAGDTARVVSTYLSRSIDRPGASVWIDLAPAPRIGTGEVRFVAARYAASIAAASASASETGTVLPPAPCGPIEFELTLDSDADRVVGSLALSITDQHGTKLVDADTEITNRPVALVQGRNHVRLRIRNLYLNSGVYRVGLWAADPIRGQSTRGAYDYLESAFEIEIADVPGGSETGAGAPVYCEFDVATDH